MGSDCLPRVLTTAVKLKPRKIYGEKTLPFDLCRSYDLKKIIKFIETDFKTYFDNLTTSLTITKISKMNTQSFAAEPEAS